jgi:diguanylate cyclase (GGDEF)-like protein
MGLQESLPTKSRGGGRRRRDRRWSKYPGWFLDWVISGPKPQPADIRIKLLHHSLTKKNTLIVIIFAMALVASVAVFITGQIWAWAWLLAEIVLGIIRISIQNAFTQAEAAGRRGNAIAPIVAGLIWGAVLAAAAYRCVTSGEWILILLSGICLAGLVGGISSRNAGTPRYAVILMCLVSLPYAFATYISPIPNLFFVGLQIPLYLTGVIFVLWENYNVLLDLYHAERENRWLAHHDLLTGLPNRVLELKRFDELLREPRDVLPTGQPPCTVFCLDLDGFKQVNDRFGHAAGDAVLVAVADRLRDSVRDVDFLCRIGGDEFVILLPAISPAEAAVVARRIIDRVSEPFEIEETPLRIGISVGSACAPDDGTTADELLRSADRALYEAKRRGKGVFIAQTELARELVELAPAADADTRIGQRASNRPETGTSRFPLPFRSKSL